MTDDPLQQRRDELTQSSGDDEPEVVFPTADDAPEDTPDDVKPDGPTAPDTSDQDETRRTWRGDPEDI